MGIINSGFKPIGSYLQEGPYNIPDYQREYSWEESELEDFWTDLIQLHEEKINNHFLGQIVIQKDKEDEKRYIIDGQQRTCTTVILLNSFRQAFKYIQNEDAKIDSEDITTKYIGRLTDTRDQVLLTLGKKDKDYFKDYVQRNEKREKDEKLLSKSEKRIKFASQYFDKKIKEYLESSTTENEQYEVLREFYDTFLKKFNLMYVETDDINEAFIIFETLNARGKDLETADLLKNHIFRVSNKKIDDVQTKWQNMLDNLDKIDTTKYIRHFWNAQYSFIREKDLYKKIRQKIDSPREAEEFITTLETLSNVYSTLNNPKDNSFFDNPELNQKLISLDTLGASSFYPIVLALYNEKYSEEDILEAVSALEVLIVRNFVVAGKVANKFEIEFAKIDINISQHTFVDKDEIITAIKKLIIADEEFLSAFKLFSIKKKNVIRYLYQKIENNIQKEVQIINDNNKIHIEHIMPQKKTNWENISDEEHDTFLWRFGNLTLLGSEYNRSASNKTFDEKLKVYEKSEITFTKDITQYNEWGPKEIEDRQSKLAEQAIFIWKK